MTPPMRIELQEYGAPVVCRGEDIDLRALTAANKRWKRVLRLSEDPIWVENIGNGQVTLRAKAVTGVIRIGDTDIEIAPKFLSAPHGRWQTVLWRILTVVEGGHVDDCLTSAHHPASLSIPDLLADMFLASYAKGAARGLPRCYLEVQANGTTLRGSLDTSRLREWIAHPWELPYIADLLVDDTPLARLLRWSAECLAATVKSPGRARAVREIASSLCHVGRQPPSAFFHSSAASLASSLSESSFNKAAISDARHTVVRGPSLIGLGKRPLLTPTHHPLALMGMSSKTCGKRKR